MYMRTTQRRNKNGSTVRYVALAHNRRDGDRVKAETLVNLGREDRLDVAGLRRLVGSISRYLGDEAEAPLVEGGQTGELEVIDSRPVGASWLLDGLWHRLGIAETLQGLLGARRFTTDVERVLFALVANRAIAPSSKLAAAEWDSHDVVIPGLEAMDDDQAYRAMDLLVEADTEGALQQAVFFAAADLLNLSVDVLLFDTTSTYFETEHADANDDGGGGLRRRGHSKDHRGDLPQIVIGLAVTREGIPVRCWTWPGNTADQSVLQQVKDDLRGWRLGRVITVVDRGLSSDDNLAYLRRAGGHWIAGERLRDGRADHEHVLSRQGRYQQVADNLRVKEVTLDSGDGRRWIVCHNPAEAERDAARREDTLARLEAELDRIDTARARTAKKKAGTKKTNEEAAHTRAECALRDHPSLGRYLRQQKNGRLRLNRAAIDREARLDGKFLISTSDPDLPAGDVAVAYKNLLEAERGFRDLKSTLELRPVFHRLDHRIRAHVLICWLALLLTRVAERAAGQTWPRINTELSRVHQVTITTDAGQATHTTSLTATQRETFAACDLKPPPRVTHLDPT